MKLHLDEDLSPVLAEILRQRGIDTTSAHEAGTTQLSDDQQLRHASRADRILVTRNLREFVLLAADWIARGQTHSGIILIPTAFRGNEFAAIADAIERIVSANPNGLRGIVVYANRA